MRKLFFAVAASLVLAACSTQPPAPEQGGAGVTNATPSALKSGGGAQGQAGSQGRVQAQGVASGNMSAGELATLKNPHSLLFKRSVYFDFDQFVVKNQYKPMIQAHARFLVGHPKIKMLIQGNTDERGSREYNLALGQKRADAVRNMLVLLGAKTGQIETVSFGEEKPRNPGHNEAAWAENRRADIVYPGEH